MPARNPDTTAQIVETYRILDASANRAREGLRVVEDYVRFVLDDSFLTRELKQLRHELTRALGQLGHRPLLASRETQHDVGTRVSTSQEKDRAEIVAVAAANFKRAQEALRSLEEFSKLVSTGEPTTISESFEQMRYRLYILERATHLVSESRERLKDIRLYVLVSSAGCRHGLEATVRGALEGGAQVIQLREKDLADRELLNRAKSVRRWTREANALFIMNDRPDLARLSDADGVHVGQDELRVKDARRILGPDRLIGVSTHDLEQVRQAVLDGADYLGIGPVFASATKTFSKFAGLEFIRQATEETSLPAFAIGGITTDNVTQVMKAGTNRIAVSAAVCTADHPAETASLLREYLSII